MFRHVDIYIPAAITNDKSPYGASRSKEITNTPYPVFYLLHGINGYEGSWQDKGSAIDTLEALIASGRCQPLILVMPDCNKWPFVKRPVDRTNKWKCVLNYSRLRREHRIEYALSDLIDMIDSTYCVSTGYTAGLSDGARMAVNIANLRPDCIRAVGLFSPVMQNKQMPRDTTQNYSVYVGTKDIFKPSGAHFHKRLLKAGIPHRYIEWRYSHDWDMWQDCLSDFLKNM